MSLVTKKSDVRSGDVATVAGVEQVIGRVDGIVTRRAGDRVDLHGFVQATTGATTTSTTLRLRRGTDTTGQLLSEANVEPLTAAAGSLEGHSIDAVDNPGEVTGQSYVLTIVHAGLAGVVNYAELAVEVSSEV